MPQPDIAPGFIVIHGNQSETLRDLICDWMRAHPLAPLENEVILVQSNGIAQWLTLSLAADPVPVDAGRPAFDGRGLGIAAAIDLQLPSRFIWQAYRAVLGEDQVPERSPFGKELLTWRLMRLLPALVARPQTQAVFEPLRRFLEDDPQLRRLHQLAAQLADLFDQYQVYRADWLEDWAHGHDRLRDSHGLGRGNIKTPNAMETQARSLPDQAGKPLPEDARWQPLLWRELLADVGPGAAGDNRATIHQRFIDACMSPDAERPAGLPRRVVVFGISAMPRQALEVLSALGRWCQVLMCVQNPCRHYWGDIVPEREWLAGLRRRHAHRPGVDPALSHLAAHGQPLLAAWGRQGRDFIGLLTQYDEEQGAAETRLLAIDRRADIFIDHEPADTLLLQLQQDILDLAPLAETRSRWPAVDPRRDRSIRFQICHSAQREVEVLHDQLLAAFAADPTLQPRDVIVMVPDIATYAPHIQAVFGLYPPQDPRFIPFSMADQQSRSHEPLLAAVEFLLDLPQARLSVSEVLDLLEVSSLQQRFGIEAEQLPQLRGWIEKSGIRWGLDPAQRQSLELDDAVAQNSWWFGLQRMLLGYVAGHTGTWSDIEPLDEISGLDGELLGRLLALVRALQDTWQDVRNPATPQEWGVRLQAMLDRFFVADEGREGILLMRLSEALQQWLDDCAEAQMDLPLPLSVVREHWLASFDDEGLGRRFFAGAVTFATLMPMRAIPFRHVCLLGMNDGDFPRSRQPADFDLMGNEYRPGDRSRREDDRYLFLEALLSAREQLSISWVGRSVHDDSPRPPSVLVAQLRDHIVAGWRLDGRDEDAGTALLEALTTQHRLQPFSRAYFVRDGAADSTRAGDDDLFSYSNEWRKALQQAEMGHADHASEGGEVESDVAENAVNAASVSGSSRWPMLPPAEWPEELTLEELTRFLKRPVAYFFRKRLDIHWQDEDAVVPDHEPFSLDGLQQWQLQADLIASQQHRVAVTLSSPGAATEESGSTSGLKEDLADMLAEERAEALTRFARAGQLPVGAFGELMREKLDAPMAEMFETYLEGISRCPTVLPDEAFLWPEQPSVSPPVVGTLDQLRAGSEGERVRLLISASNLVNKGSGKKASSGKGSRSSSGGGKDSSYRYDKLLDYWVHHVTGNLSGMPLRTRIIGKEGSMVELMPLDREAALAYWQDLLQAWNLACRRPLPLAAKTGFAWVLGGSSEDPGKRQQAAQMAYEGSESSFGGVGECLQDEYLMRAYPDFQALEEAGEFAQWSERLLQPLADAVVRKGAASRHEGSGEGDTHGE